MAKQKKDISSFRAMHDKSVIIPARIRTAFATMIKTDGSEAWEYEGDLSRLAGVGPPDFRDYKELFKDHMVETPPTNGRKSARVVWFADPKVAARVRKDMAQQ
jgi:hypothetical protein